MAKKINAPGIGFYVKPAYRFNGDKQLVKKELIGYVIADENGTMVLSTNHIFPLNEQQDLAIEICKHMNSI